MTAPDVSASRSDSSNTPVVVALAEDPSAVRDGLAALLVREGGFAVGWSASSALEVKAQLERETPAVLVMDLALGDDDGLTLIKELADLRPGLRIVVFSLQPEEVYAEQCMRAGAHGYVMKREPVPTLFQAIREVADGGIFLSARVVAAALGAWRGQN